MRGGKSQPGKFEEACQFHTRRRTFWKGVGYIKLQTVARIGELENDLCSIDEVVHRTKVYRKEITPCFGLPNLNVHLLLPAPPPHAKSQVGGIALRASANNTNERLNMNFTVVDPKPDSAQAGPQRPPPARPAGRPPPRPPAPPGRRRPSRGVAWAHCLAAETVVSLIEMRQK